LTGVGFTFKHGEESNENNAVTEDFPNPAVTRNLRVWAVPADARLVMLVSLNQSVDSHNVCPNPITPLRWLLKKLIP
jgi:hypothetical protein